MNNLPILIITGLSGSGKTTVAKVLEDLGFFCLDNMPIVFLPNFLELRLSSASEISKVAIVIDIRSGEFLEEAPRIIEEMKGKGHKVDVLFLDCDEKMLLRRFSETRRTHPLDQKGRSPLEAIREERERLSALRAIADEVIDTSAYSVHQLRDYIERYFMTASAQRKIRIFLQSFGYRYGIPANTDLVMDVRFLPNPYFVDTLRGRTGLDPEVAVFVLERNESKEFLNRLCGLVEWLLPYYEKEGKSYLTISFGCTGGKHRSVAIVEKMRAFFDDLGYTPNIQHRDVDK